MAIFKKRFRSARESFFSRSGEEEEPQPVRRTTTIKKMSSRSPFKPRKNPVTFTVRSKNVTTSKPFVKPIARVFASVKSKTIVTDLKNKTMALVEKKKSFLASLVSGISGGISFGKTQILPFAILAVVLFIFGFGVVKASTKSNRR